MRLVAWNCCRGPLDRKLAALQAVEPDLAVVPECPEPPRAPGTALWFGTKGKPGLGVFARGPWRIARATRRGDLPRYVEPVRVTGPESFTLWAVWACAFRPHRYVRAMHHALDLSPRLLRRRPNVLLGDFNSNTIWDHEHPADRGHSALVTRLEALDLVSSYHTHHGDTHGRERTPTFYEYRHRNRPYHLDYCFIPKAWLPRLTAVTVGGHAEWSRESDHMPVVVEIGG